MGKALFFDIDGTLENFQGTMPDSARDALKKVQAAGHKIVLCSGRSKCQIYPWLTDMRFDGIICATGAYAECNGRIIYEHHMEEAALVAARNVLERARACYCAQTLKGIVATAEGKKRMICRFRAMGLSEDMISQVWKDAQVDERLEQRSDIEKLLFHESAIPVGLIREELAKHCDVTESSFERPVDDAGEITSRGINKASGMKKYIEYAGIMREDTIAFGDGPNDFDMLEYAKVGVAMGNGISTLKKMADYVTAAVDDDGIASALHAFGLL